MQWLMRVVVEEQKVKSSALAKMSCMQVSSCGNANKLPLLSISVIGDQDAAASGKYCCIAIDHLEMSATHSSDYCGTSIESSQFANRPPRIHPLGAPRCRRPPA